jgi:hypothetical protein
VKQYKHQERMMKITVTQSELIAIGHVVTHYLTWWERQPRKANEVQELMTLLRSFQGRIVAYTQQPPRPSFPTTWEVQR